MIHFDSQGMFYYRIGLFKALKKKFFMNDIEHTHLSFGNFSVFILVLFFVLFEQSLVFPRIS